MISLELALKCFPHKEAILYNLDVALQLKDELVEPDRIQLLCECHEALRDNRYKEAAKLSRQANYECMAIAIEHHFKEK